MRVWRAEGRVVVVCVGRKGRGSDGAEVIMVVECICGGLCGV